MLLVLPLGILPDDVPYILLYIVDYSDFSSDEEDHFPEQPQPGWMNDLIDEVAIAV